MSSENKKPAPERPHVEMVAEHLCPFCGERATLHCALCERVVCAEHVTRGFALGYAFICVECAAAYQDSETNAE